MDLRLPETAQEKLYLDQITQSWWASHVSSARDNHTLESFVQNVMLLNLVTSQGDLASVTTD
jgi:hypothetical protein